METTPPTTTSSSLSTDEWMGDPRSQQPNENKSDHIIFRPVASRARWIGSHLGVPESVGAYMF
jgi:hypothetical protein